VQKVHLARVDALADQPSDNDEILTSLDDHLRRKQVRPRPRHEFANEDIFGGRLGHVLVFSIQVASIPRVPRLGDPNDIRLLCLLIGQGSTAIGRSLVDATAKVLLMDRRSAEGTLRSVEPCEGIPPHTGNH